ncbi:MAG: hypothetical protein H6537_11685 [Bacteroidales bacterium]|nr:hypothetical protein [Bacteroidales bacterium]
MKRRAFLLLFSTFLLIGTGYSQDVTKPKVEVKPYGYVRTDLIYDTYKNLDVRDGEIIFYPLKEKLDVNGNNVNEQNQLQLLSITTRLGLKMSGPDVLGAKTSAMVETDFYATANDLIYQLRLRHAMVNLKWESSELIVGQYWHPMFVTETAPSVLTFGAAAAFHALNRSPQIRYTIYPIQNLRMSFTALSQGYHRTKGPTDAQRNSGLPELVYQIAAGNRKTFIAGINAGYKWLTPRLVTDSNYVTNQRVGQYEFSAFVMKAFGNTKIKAEAIYGENLTHLNMIGGYGMETGSLDTSTNRYNYANLRTLSTWIDISHSIKKLDFGLFVGYTKQMGSNKKYTQISSSYERNADMNYVYRISPRFSYTIENFKLSAEYMITTSVYGKTFDDKQKATSSYDPVSDNRITLSASYTF